MRKIAFIIYIIITVSGCVKKTDWPLPGNSPELLVVDGIISDERKPQSIRLTWPVSQLNTLPLPVSGAILILSDETSSWQLTENASDPGSYFTDSTFLAQPGNTYTLIIYLEGRIYSAKTYMIPGAVFNELQYVKDQAGDLFRIDWVASAFSSTDPAMWEIYLDWSTVAGYENTDSADCQARMLFYTLPTLDVSEIFAPQMEKILFPAGTLITERRYSVTPEHAEFLREMLLETSWTGGLFSLANSNVSTNLSSGAIGYFGACSVTSLSLTVTP